MHRDLKPGNVMLSDGVAVVTDFGIARLVGDAAQQQLTQTGLVIGTPAYMSPEQAMGDATAVSPASDQYSLACVVFEMLSGRTPFQGSSALATLALHNSGAIPDVRQLRDGHSAGCRGGVGDRAGEGSGKPFSERRCVRTRARRRHHGCDGAAEGVAETPPAFAWPSARDSSSLP